MVVGKEAQVLQLARGIIKNGDGPGPSRMLGVTEFAQIEKGFLESTVPARKADAFNDAIIAMLFAVFLAGDEAQKHTLARVCQNPRGSAQGGRSSLQHFFGILRRNNLNIIGVS
jgi:hypothetical protein